MTRTDIPEARVGRVVRVTEAEHESKREDAERLRAAYLRGSAAHHRAMKEGVGQGR